MTLRVKARPAVHLVSFHTEGAPFDSGSNLSESAAQFLEAANYCFDSVRIATPASLEKQDDSWGARFCDYTAAITTHSDFTDELRWNPAWARTGLFSWKPRLILESLLASNVASGDIVFYHDSDSKKYPEYLSGIEYWARWISGRMRKLDLLVFRDNRARMISDTKPELWEQFFSHEEVDSLTHIWGGAIAFRKTAPSMSFVEEWDRLVRIPENILPVTKGFRRPGFVQHSPDQAILTCLWHARHALFPDLRGDLVSLGGSRVIPPTLPSTRFSRFLVTLRRRRKS